MTPNATCIIRAFAKSASGTGALARTWAETPGAEIRCRMTQATASATVSVLGELGPQLYHCAVVSSEDIRPGWRVEVVLDDDGETRTYTVRNARKRLGHWHLLVERV